MGLAEQRHHGLMDPDDDQDAPPGEFKLVFAGPMGAGKTTAIAALSDAPPVSTEVDNSDQDACAKATTTVGLDYGVITLNHRVRVHLYGTPGQERFRFMWGIVGRQAAGILLLFDASHPDALAHLDAFAGAFDRTTPIVVGVGRTEAVGALTVDAYVARLQGQGRVLSVFSVDVRRREDVLFLVDTLLTLIEVGGMESE